jgi:hypothetical protein
MAAAFDNEAFMQVVWQNPSLEARAGVGVAVGAFSVVLRIAVGSTCCPAEYTTSTRYRCCQNIRKNKTENMIRTLRIDDREREKMKIDLIMIRIAQSFFFLL